MLLSHVNEWFLHCQVSITRYNVCPGKRDNLPAGRHAWTSRRVADCGSILFLLMDYPHKVPEVPVVLNDLKTVNLSPKINIPQSGFLTLVSDPLALFHSLRSCTEGHEIALNNVFCIGDVQPQRERSWQVVAAQRIVWVGLVHANVVGQRRRTGQRRYLRGKIGGRLAALGEVCG